MKQNKYPKTLTEAVNICLLTMSAAEKSAIKNTSAENTIMFHFGWAVNIRNKFGMWDGNHELVESCGADEPDGASMAIVRAVWEKLQDTH